MSAHPNKKNFINSCAFSNFLLNIREVMPYTLTSRSLPFKVKMVLSKLFGLLEKSSSIFTSIFCALVLITIILQVYKLSTQDHKNPESYTTTSGIHNKSQWMTNLRHKLESKRLGDIIIPGTHNSGSYSINIENATLIDQFLPFKLAVNLGFKVSNNLIIYI